MLKAKGIIEKIGSNKNGYWKILNLEKIAIEQDRGDVRILNYINILINNKFKNYL